METKYTKGEWLIGDSLTHVECDGDLLEALKTINNAFWTDGETAEDQVKDLKFIAEQAIKKATE